MELQTDTIYTDGDTFMFSPDGVGRVFFDSLAQAQDETGLPVTHVSDEWMSVLCQDGY